MEDALKRAEDLRIEKSKGAGERVRGEKSKFDVKKRKINYLNEVRQIEIGRIIAMKLELASERKILNRLKKQNEREDKVNTLEG